MAEAATLPNPPNQSVRSAAEVGPTAAVIESWATGGVSGRRSSGDGPPPCSGNLIGVFREKIINGLSNHIGQGTPRAKGNQSEPLMLFCLDGRKQRNRRLEFSFSRHNSSPRKEKASERRLHSPLLAALLIRLPCRPAQSTPQLGRSTSHILPSDGIAASELLLRTS